MFDGKTRSFSITRKAFPESKYVLPVPISRLAHRHLPLLLSYATVSGLLLKVPLLHSVLRSLSTGPVPSLSLSFLSLLHRSGYMPIDNYSLSAALSTAARMPSVVVGAQLHTLSVKLGLSSDTFVLNTLINMYSSCSIHLLQDQFLILLPKEPLIQFLGIQSLLDTYMLGCLIRHCWLLAKWPRRKLCWMRSPC